MLKRLILLALAAVAGWIAYRRTRAQAAPFAPPFAPATTETTRLPLDQPPPTAAPWPAPGSNAAHAPDAPPAEVVEQAHGHAPPVEPPVPEHPVAETPASPEAAEQLAAHHEPAAEAHIDGYCMRCKTRRTISDPRIEISENGRTAARGTCPVCGASMYKFLPSEG